MKTVVVEAAKCSVIDFGPGYSGVVSAVKFKADDNSPEWLSLVEVDGIPTFYLSDEDIFDDLLDEEEDIEEYETDDFYGLELGEYDDLMYELVYGAADYDEIVRNEVVRFVIAITRATEEDTEKLINEAKGKKLYEEFTTPTIDLEEEVPDPEEIGIDPSDVPDDVLFGEDD